jgi:site-specific DNA recombinase
MIERAVLYARVSSDDRGKDGRNLAGQLEMGREYAQTHGYQIVAELAEDDRGASGAKIDLPELTKVREMAQAGEFDILVVREIDRLSRNLAKQLIVEQELQRAGVRIEYVLGEYPDTPEGNLMKHVRATIAEYEREKINERMSRGRHNKVKAGHVMTHGKTPYGYQLADVDGKHTLVVCEPEARVVRLVFDWYVGGVGGVHKLARKLTEMKVPTRRDIEGQRSGEAVPRSLKKRPFGHWSGETVYVMITNETYAGKWRYANTEATVDVPPIIDRETWELAQERREKNKDVAKRNTKHDYLLRRCVTCGDCGLKMYGRSRSYNTKKGKRCSLYYACPATNKGAYARECNMSKSFRADWVDATVWAWVCDLFTDPELFMRGVRRAQERREEANKPLRDHLTIVDGLLAENRPKYGRLLDLYLSGDFDKDLLTERKARLERTIADLEQERARLVERLEAATLTDEQVETLAAIIREVGEGLDLACADFDKRRWIVERLNLTATLDFDEDGQMVAHVECYAGYDTLSIVSSSSGSGTWSSHSRR